MNVVSDSLRYRVGTGASAPRPNVHKGGLAPLNPRRL